MKEQDDSRIQRWLRPVQDALNRPLPGTSAPEWLRSSRLWIVLNRPLPGTQPRAKPVWIEGRLTRLQSSIVLLICFPLGLLGSKLGFKALGDVVGARGCEPGLGGYSVGREIVLAIMGSMSLMGTLLGVYALGAGWRIYKRRRNVPAGYRPWFPTRLFEGRAAVLRGAWMMFCSAIMLLLCAWMWYLLAFQMPKFFLIRPAEIEMCQSPHLSKANPSESVAPISEKP